MKSKESSKESTDSNFPKGGIQNKENYKSSLQANILEIVDKYSKLVIEYLLFIIENIGSKKATYSKFIIIRGLNTITHVFSTLLYYSNNLDMAYYHSQKSFYFYVEFIGQISEDQHSFLQLSSRDASIFVYKKTIFEIPVDIKNQASLESSAESLESVAESLNKDQIQKQIQVMEMFDQYKIIIYIFFQKTINNLVFNNTLENKKQYLVENIGLSEKIIDLLIGQSFFPTSQDLNNIIYLIKQIDQLDLDNKQYYKLLEYLLKKYTKLSSSKKEKIQQKIIDPIVLKQNYETYKTYKTYNQDKFIELLIA
jgi:hypothetical protein